MTREDHDEALLGRLRALARRADPPPQALEDSVRASLTWRDVDRELAHLVYDSATDAQSLAGLRGSAGTRTLTFAAGDVTVELETSASPSDRGRRLVGQVVPPQPAQVVVRSGEGEQAVRADAVGQFVVDEVPGGPLSLRVRLGTGDDTRVVDTEWLPI